MATGDICRLCLREDKLVWVFDNKVRLSKPNCDIPNVIYVITGVQIQNDDEISQMVCSSCVAFSHQAYIFRQKAINSNNYLKAALGKKLKSTNLQDSGNSERGIVDVVPPKNKENMSKWKRNIHPSIRALYTSFNDIKLPTFTLGFNVDPCVWLDRTILPKYVSENRVTESSELQTYLEFLRKDQPLTTDATSTSICTEIPNTVLNKTSNDLDCDKYDSSEEHIVIRKAKIIRRLISSDSESNLSSSTEDLPYTCTICRSKHNTFNEYKIHRRKHFECQFCKHSFKFLERKERHEVKCIVKETLNSKPYVQLERLKPDFINKFVLNYNSFDHKDDEIIELSDEDEIDNVHSRTEPIERPINTIKYPNYTVINPVGAISVLPEEKEKSVTKTANIVSSTTPPTNNPSAPNEQTQSDSEFLSTAVVRPDIQILDQNTFVDKSLVSIITGENLATDLSVFKNVLARVLYTQPIISVSNSSQTYMPISVFTNNTNTSATLANLIPHLQFYKIPIDVGYGRFEVRYTQTEVVKKKQMYMWDTTKTQGLENDTNFTMEKFKDVFNIKGSELRQFRKQIQGTKRPIPIQSKEVLQKKQKNVILNTEVQKQQSSLVSVVPSNSKQSSKTSQYTVYNNSVGQTPIQAEALAQVQPSAEVQTPAQTPQKILNHTLFLPNIRLPTQQTTFVCTEQDNQAQASNVVQMNVINKAVASQYPGMVSLVSNTQIQSTATLINNVMPIQASSVGFYPINNQNVIFNNPVASTSNHIINAHLGQFTSNQQISSSTGNMNMPVISSSNNFNATAGSSIVTSMSEVSNIILLQNTSTTPNANPSVTLNNLEPIVSRPMIRVKTLNELK